LGARHWELNKITGALRDRPEAPPGLATNREPPVKSATGFCLALVVNLLTFDTSRHRAMDIKGSILVEYSAYMCMRAVAE